MNVERGWRALVVRTFTVLLTDPAFLRSPLYGFIDIRIKARDRKPANKPKAVRRPVFPERQERRAPAARRHRDEQDGLPSGHDARTPLRRWPLLAGGEDLQLPVAESRWCRSAVTPSICPSHTSRTPQARRLLLSGPRQGHGARCRWDMLATLSSTSALQRRARPRCASRPGNVLSCPLAMRHSFGNKQGWQCVDVLALLA